jgi:hypothetical protein
VKYWSINYLQGKAMLENALNNPALSDAEKRTVQQQAQTKGIGAALGLLGGLLQAARERYRALEAKIEREEAEEERRWQSAHTPASPAFDMTKWKQQDYAESARWEPPQPIRRIGRGSGASSCKTFRRHKPPLTPSRLRDYNLSHPLPGEKDLCCASINQSINQSIEFSSPF